MTLQTIFDYLESAEFQAAMSVFSGFTSFRTTLENVEAVKDLVLAIKTDREGAIHLFRRFTELYRSHQVPDYAHPADTTLAVYLYALHQFQPGLARVAISPIQRDNRIWWTQRLARYFQETEEVRTSFEFIKLGNFSPFVFSVYSSDVMTETHVKFTKKIFTNFRLRVVVDPEDRVPHTGVGVLRVRDTILA